MQLLKIFYLLKWLSCQLFKLVYKDIWPVYHLFCSTKSDLRTKDTKSLVNALSAYGLKILEKGCGVPNYLSFCRQSGQLSQPKYFSTRMYNTNVNKQTLHVKVVCLIAEYLKRILDNTIVNVAFLDPFYLP